MNSFRIAMCDMYRCIKMMVFHKREEVVIHALWEVMRGSSPKPMSAIQLREHLVKLIDREGELDSSTFTEDLKRLKQKEELLHVSF